MLVRKVQKVLLGAGRSRLAVAVAACLFAAPALATDVGSTKEAGGKSGPSSSPASGSEGPSAASEGGLPQSGEVERQLGNGAWYSLEKRFQFDAGWELHSMLVQNNLVGNGAETLFNYFYARAGYYFTKDDKLQLLVGLYMFALGDPDETPLGWRADDMLLRYNHHFRLPWKLTLDVAGSVTAPTSFVSAKMGLITEPELRATVERTFFKYLTVDVRLFASYYWQTYTSVQGGSTPNPYAQFGGIASVELECPWWKPLAVGADFETDYIAYYNPDGAPGSIAGVPGNAGPAGPYYGLETNPIYSGQPLQQEYGVDVYVRYDLPKFHGITPSLELAYAQGEITAGYTSDLVDGVANLYLFYPESSEVYGGITLKY